MQNVGKVVQMSYDNYGFGFQLDEKGAQVI